ncbi:MAG: DUF2059 domain-containing protein [Kangiella sp.]|jgi:hypothetical protein|nr:DUF2059 domain-containing protein [Kangiella sp.]
MKKILVSLFMLFCLTNTSFATEKSVDRLFDIMNMDEQLNGGFEAMLPVIDQMAVEFELDAEAKEELASIYRAWFYEDIDRSRMMGKMKDLYVDAFTEQEIEEAIKFYETPAGQKFIKLNPELMKRGTQIGMAEAKSKQTLLLNRLKPFFEKHDIK